MPTRRDALYATAALGALVIGRLVWPHAAHAEKTYEVSHTDAEWKKILTPDAYEVLRHEGTERPFTSPLLHEHHAGRIRLRRLRPAALLIEDEIRQRYRLAEFLGAAR